MAGRKGSGAWVEKAARLASRLAEMDANSADPLSEVAAEAGLTVAVTRRYLDGYASVRHFAGDIRISLVAAEHLKTWSRLDPLAASARREEALAGRVPLSDIQRAITDARIRAAVPRPAPSPVPVEHLVDRFIGADTDLPHLEWVAIPARGEEWIGLSADVTELSVDGDEQPMLIYRWALLQSPAVSGSPLAGLAFADFLIRIAATAAIYAKVGVQCSSSFEAEEITRLSHTWWSSDASSRVSVLI